MTTEQWTYTLNGLKQYYKVSGQATTHKQLISQWMQLPILPTSAMIWTPIDTAHWRSSNVLHNRLDSVWHQQHLSLRTKLQDLHINPHCCMVLTLGGFSDPAPGDYRHSTCTASDESSETSGMISSQVPTSLLKLIYMTSRQLLNIAQLWIMVGGKSQDEFCKLPSYGLQLKIGWGVVAVRLVSRKAKPASQPQFC